MPGKLFTAQWLRQGVLPLWNPTIFTGLPWIGDVNQSALYPSTLLFMCFSPAIALNLTLVFHVVLTFVGMYLASKKILNSHVSAIVASIVWTLSTQITAVLNNISTLQSLSWLPLIVYLGLFIHYEFKYRFFFALAIFFQFAGGYPSHVLYSILLAVFFSFINKPENQSLWMWGWKWFQSALLSICLTAVIWLPFLEVLNNSTRTIQTSEQSFSGSLHPLELIKLIVPYFFDHPTEGIKWGPSWNSMPNVSMYFGWLGLLGLGFFTFKQKKTKEEYVWIILLIISIIFSLGEYFPIDFSFLIGSSRGPSTALIASIFFIALIVGKMLPTFQVKKQYLIFSFFAIFIGSLGYLLVNVNFYNLWQLLNEVTQNRLLNSPFHTIEKNRLIAQNISIYLILNSSFLLISLALLKIKKYLFLSAILILDLVLNTQGMLFFAPNEVYPQDSSMFIFKEQLIQDSQARTLIRNYNSPYTDFGAYWEALAVRQPFSDSYIDDWELIEFNHLKRMSQGMTPDWNMVAGVNILNGYTTLMPIRMNELWNEEALLNPSINNLPEIKTDNDLLADWSVKYYLVDHWFSRRENFSDYQLIQDK
ncbi:YfhO family protein, partial [Candidatus Micrarchaeota archaeon]|nr:YfhO family protein [Candidatus Micrarchaeota archaeon]